MVIVVTSAAPQSKKQKRSERNPPPTQKKKWHYRPGTVALREIRYYQKTWNLIIPAAPFIRTVSSYLPCWCITHLYPHMHVSVLIDV